MITNEQALKIANGNKDAARFVQAFVCHCHVLDDVIDKDKPVTDEVLIGTEASWLIELTHNPFFVANKAMLVPIILNAFNAWLDSNRMATSEDENVKRASDVVKGFYHEVCWQVALITGGWKHMRSITSEHREYDYDHGMLQRT